MKGKVIALAILSLALFAIVAYAVQGGFGASYDGFEDMQSGGSFTLYYADWCPHCQTIKPVFKHFMGNGTVSVNGQPVAVRMIQPEKEPEKCKGVDIKGYPTLLYSDASGKITEFSGPRTADGFMAFLKEQVLS